MIVRADGDRLVIIRQADHAHLSGRLAAAWGLSPWGRPAPLPQVALGSRLHDDAWEPYDGAPEVVAGRPLSFFEVDRVTTSAMYRDGVTAVTALDRYAGLLVSLHYSGFFTSHWGWTPFSTPDRFREPQAGALRQFLAGEAARQRELRAGLGFESQDERRLEVNYKWLQLWDGISLDICRRSTVEPWTVVYPAVPAMYNGAAEIPLRLVMVAPGRYALDPYPLLVEPFDAVLPAVNLGVGFASSEQFQRAWSTAPQHFLKASISAWAGFA